MYRLALIVVIVLPTPRAAARTPAAKEAAEAKVKARAAYLRARRHYDAERYPEALAELKRAYSLLPFRVLLRYIADCYYAMKRYPLALKYYRRYLERARYAQDKAQIGRRVRELEESLSVEEHGPRLAERKAKLPPELIPDGHDVEVPSDLSPSPPPTSAPVVPPAARARDGVGRRVLRVAKWSALGAGVVTLAIGVTYNLLAKSKAQELEDNVRNACPDGEPGCGGNPDLTRPVTAFSPAQYELERTYLRYRNRSIGFFTAASVAAAAAVVLFILDWPGRGGPGVGVGVGPGRAVTFSGEASF